MAHQSADPATRESVRGCMQMPERQRSRRRGLFADDNSIGKPREGIETSNNRFLVDKWLLCHRGHNSVGHSTFGLLMLPSLGAKKSANRLTDFGICQPVRACRSDRRVKPWGWLTVDDMFSVCVSHYIDQDFVAFGGCGDQRRGFSR